MLFRSNHDRLFSYTRSYKGCKLLVLCNYSDDILYLGGLNLPTTGDIVISNYGKKNHDLKLLKPYEAIVIDLEI